MKLELPQRKFALRNVKVGSSFWFLWFSVLSRLGRSIVQSKGAVKLLRQADPKRAAFTLALAFNESVLQQFLDVVVGATAAKVDQF